ncbi:MAG TPA: M20/M25/M40 family metallo-hydrolase, partial [Lacipirellulaceae bacterium]|nr:M20/M25/M40 family metallo-hydrolase [Lacipirellulaceae bacterium]
MAASWQTTLDELIAGLGPSIAELRRQLHANPEPSGQELATSLEVYQRLSAAGLAVQMGPDGCGVVVDNAQAAPAPRVAFRADLDALRIQDEKTVPYRSQVPGVMHACGHDAHTAIAYGVCQALLELERRGAAPWPLAWRAIFQPAEETAAG